MDQNINFVQDSQVQPLSNSPISPDTSQNTVNNTLPKWYSRLAAYILDGLIFLIILVPFYIIFGVLTAVLNYPEQVSALGVLLIFILTVLIAAAYSFYFAYFHSKNGQTWGMKFIGIKITKEDGSFLSLQDAFLRSVFVAAVPGLLSAIPVLGFLSTIYLIVLVVLILTDKNNQGFHDKMFKAVYSKVEENTSRAKWTLGCYCGCLSFFIVLIIVIGIMGLGVMGSGGLMNQFGSFENLKETPEPRVREERRIEERKETQINYNDIMEEKEITTNEEKQQTNIDTGKIFYETCMESSMNNQGVDYTDYCKCAQDAYLNGMDVNQIVSSCQNRLKMN